MQGRQGKGWCLSSGTTQSSRSGHAEGEEEVTSQYGDNPAIENDEIQEIDPFSGQPVEPEGEVEKT